jgi:chromosome segregation ATPase
MFNRLKRRLDAAVTRRVDEQVSLRLAEQLAQRELDLESIARSGADYEARLGGLQADYSFLRSEFDRMAPQLAALEYRFERLRSQIGLNDPNHDEQILERAALEHERARLRLELAAHYEERLRRLETSAHA